MMKPRERILTTLSHKEPDRVPLALWGGPYGLVDPLYLKLVALLDLGDPLPPIREGHTVNHMDDRLLEALDIDTRFIWPGASPSSPTHPSKDDDFIFDDFGQPWKRTYPYYSATDGLLKNTTSIDDIEQLVQWPDVNDPCWTRGVSDRVKTLSNNGYFNIGRMVLSHGPFQMACDMRNTENFMMDLLDSPEFAGALLDRITDVICGLTENYLETAGDVMDMIELPGDDYASNDYLLFSPNLFRQFIRPRIERIIGIIRKIRPEIKIMLHSDGAIGKLLPDFVEMGIDVIHPLEPVCGMDPAKIKDQYGESISFLGGVDISHAMLGSLKDVRMDVERCLRDLARGGGYILAPCNHLQADVPAENVIDLYRYARDKGYYHKTNS